MENPELKAIFKNKCLTDFLDWYKNNDSIASKPLEEIFGRELVLLLVSFACNHGFIIRNDNLTDLRKDLIFFRINYNLKP